MPSALEGMGIWYPKNVSPWWPSSTVVSLFPQPFSLSLGERFSNAHYQRHIPAWVRGGWLYSMAKARELRHSPCQLSVAVQQITPKFKWLNTTHADCLTVSAGRHRSSLVGLSPTSLPRKPLPMCPGISG